MNGWYVFEAENCKGDLDARGGTWEQGRGSQCLSRGTWGRGQELGKWRLRAVFYLGFIISQSGEFAELNQNPRVGRGTGQKPLRRKTGDPKSRAFLLSCTSIAARNRRRGLEEDTQARVLLTETSGLWFTCTTAGFPNHDPLTQVPEL